MLLARIGTAPLRFHFEVAVGRLATTLPLALPVAVKLTRGARSAATGALWGREAFVASAALRASARRSLAAQAPWPRREADMTGATSGRWRW
jgi:hypothetical protein